MSLTNQRIASQAKTDILDEGSYEASPKVET